MDLRGAVEDVVARDVHESRALRAGGLDEPGDAVDVHGPALGPAFRGLGGVDSGARGGVDDRAVGAEVEGGDRLRQGEIQTVAADEVHVGPPLPAHGDRPPQLPVRADDEGGRRSERLQENVAERKTVIGELDAPAQLLQSILDTVDVGIVVVDADGHDILMNTRQRRIHALATLPGNDGLNEAELLLRYPGTSLPIPVDERAVRKAVLQESFNNYLVATGPPSEDGAAFSASARQILDRRGERAGAMVVFSDVTSYLEMVRSQEQFVASVSHELRTPSTSVIGYLELAQDGLDLSKATASRLQVAHRNTEQLLVIEEELLQDQVSRSGEEKLVLQPSRLSESAEHSVESFALRAERAGIALISDLQPTPEMPVDTACMRQAVDSPPPTPCSTPAVAGPSRSPPR